MKKLNLVVLLVVLFAVGLSAQDEPRQVTQTLALKNVTVVQAPGKVMEQMTIVVKDGLIHAIGKNVTVPFDAKVVKADSMFVYAGFIDGGSHVGIPKPKEEQGRRERPKGEVVSNPSYERAGIQPHKIAVEVLDAEDKSISDLRKVGFTTAHVLPRGRMLPGQGAVVQLAGEKSSEMILVDKAALFAQFAGARGVYPSTVIAVMSKFRELYKQAEQLKMHQGAYTKNPTGMARPASDDVLEAFFPVIDGEQLVFMKAEDTKDISRTMALQKELGFKLALIDVKKASYQMDALKNTPVFLSMELPDAIKEDKKKKKEDEQAGEEKEKKEEDKEMMQLKERQKEEVKNLEMMAKQLSDAKVSFGFSTLSVKPKDIKTNLNRMIEAGLTEDQALAALTTTPAGLLGIDKLVGTVEQGKIANLVVTDTTYFNKNANVRFVIVDGELFEFEAPKKKDKKKKKGEATSEMADINGTWDYELDAMGGVSGTMEITNDDGDITIIATSAMSEETEEINNATLSGNQLSFSQTMDAGGQSITITYELEFDGDAFEGTVTAGSFGSFDIEGTKKPK